VPKNLAKLRYSSS